MADLFSGPNAPLTKAFLFCGWRTISVDILLDPSHDVAHPRRQESLSQQLQDACFIFAALDCSTKSRAREIPRRFNDGRPAPAPLRSEAEPMGLAGLRPADAERVARDNSAASFVLQEMEELRLRGGGGVRENPGRSLQWHLPEEKRQLASGHWWDTEYAACAFGGARCKYQRLRHNIQEISDWPPAMCHHFHDPKEWEPQSGAGGRFFPSKEEAEYTAPLAFAVACSVSWWAVRIGHAKLQVPRMPTVETVGHRAHWLSIHPQAFRSWAMTPLAIHLGLMPLMPEERARVPFRARVQDLLKDGALPEGAIYVGQGHHSHRLARSKWAAPGVIGQACPPDEWAARYIEYIHTEQATQLPSLRGATLVCDCDWGEVCERDLLAGMVFDATSPHGGEKQPRRSAEDSKAVRRTAAQSAHTGARVVTFAAAVKSAAGEPTLFFTQEAVVLAFRKLFPAEWFTGFQFPMIQDLLNQTPFDAFLRWRASKGLQWDGPLGPLAATPRSRQVQRHAEGKQAGAYNQRAALPPLVSYGLSPDEHFCEALGLAPWPLPTEAAPLLDSDLEFAAEQHRMSGDQLRSARRLAVGALRELKRRWVPVTARLRELQTPSVRAVTARRDLGLTSLLLLLSSWADTSYPFGLIRGLPAVGMAPCYGVFPRQAGEDLTMDDVLLGWEAHNMTILQSLKPSLHDTFLLEQSLKDASKSFCTPPMTWAELQREVGGRAFRLIPTCVITQASGKQRIIDNADAGGQSERSSDHNKLVLCSALRPAQHVGAVAAALGAKQWRERITSDAFETGGEDWPEAYRHSPISDDESLGCIVAFYHEGWRAPAFQRYNSLLFGLPLAVTSFNRYSRFMEAMGRRLVFVLASLYFDDATIQDWQSAKGSAQWAFNELNTLVGTPFADEKRQPMASQGSFLGLDHDMRHLQTHAAVAFWARERLLVKLLELVRQAEEQQSLAPGMAAKMYGMMNFLEQGAYGRIGCPGLAALKQRQHETARALTAEIRRSFETMKEILRCQPRRLVEVLPPQPLRFVAASDAALEAPRAGTGGFLIVWLNPEGEHREAFVSVIPSGIYDIWSLGEKKIAQLELLQVLMALLARPDSFRNRRGVWYIDNVAALMSLIRGRSDSPDLEKMASMIHTLIFAYQSWFFWEWVPSESNWSDAISRLGSDDPWWRANRFELSFAHFPLGLWELPFRPLLNVALCL